MANIAKRFDSVGDFVRYIEAGETQKHFLERSKCEGSDFYGSESYSEACELLSRGDKDTADKIDARKRMACGRYGVELKKRLELAVAGHTPSVAAYLSGARKCMYRTAQAPARARVANVIVNVAISCGVRACDMQTAAAEVLQAISSVERGGTRLNIYVAFSSFVYSRKEKRDVEVSSVIKIKDSGQYLDILKVAYPLAHPSMLRRHALRFFEVTPGVPKEFAATYGHPSRPTKNFWEREFGIKCPIVFNISEMIDSGARSEAIAKAINEGAAK